MTRRKNEEIKRLIDHMQTGLVELFDQLRELRRLLDMPADTEMVVEPTPTPSEDAVSPGLFTGVSSSSPRSVSSATPEPSVTRSSSLSSSASPTPSPETEDPLEAFAEKVRAGSVSANELAAQLKSVKSAVITPSRPNERVERDMDIVLKFLQKRGKKGIRPEERDNILKRIQRWKAHLASDVTRGK